MEINYRALTNIECENINQINPAQFIKKAWREIDGIRQLIDINYQESGWPNGYEHHMNNLRTTLQTGGYVIGAFDEDNRLLGFAALNRAMFGKRFQYVLLDQLFISLEHRSKGIGRTLFLMCADKAKEWKADRIYICAGSAEETIKFYFKIGCREAEEINKELYESDPRDFQLEYVL